MTSKINSIIAATPLFQGLKQKELDQIHQIVTTREVARGETIFSEGDPGNGFYIVVNGKVKIYKVSLEGKEQILHIYGPGKPFGEVPVFAGDRFPANAMALAKSQLIFFRRDAFATLIAENPTLSMNMLAVLSMRLRRFAMQIESLSLKEVPGRLASYLIYLSKEQNSGHQVSLPISKGQLASLLGTIPETLSRILAKMSSQGLIRVEGKVIHIDDDLGLEDLSTHGKLT